MTGIPILIETVISLVVLYILFSIINSVLIEAFARWSKTRAKFLKNSLINLFGSETGKLKVPDALSFAPKLLTTASPVQRGATFVEEIYNHKLLEKLKIFDKGKINSMDKGLFADIIISLITSDSEITSKSGLMQKIDSRANLSEDMKAIFGQVILRINEEKGELFKQFRDHITNWYDFYMEKATQSYRNHIRKFLFISGLVLATVMNLDTIFLAEWFYKNPDARESYVRLGEQLNKDSIQIDTSKLTAFIIANKNKLDANALLDHVLKNANTNSDEAIEYTEPVALPIGVWKTFKRSEDSTVGDGFWSFKVIGILITALALSFGAPFWFDVLKKLMTARSQLSASTAQKE